MQPEEITTFDQARTVFEQHGQIVEKSPEPKIWIVGGVQRLDKGGMIQEARSLAARKAQQATMTPPTPPTAGSTPVHLRIRQIRRDGGTQSRAGIDEATVAEYADAMLNGAVFPPVKTWFDGTDFWLEDGFQRLAAAERIGGTTFLAEVRQGTRRDAVLASCGANADHGLRRKTEDKARAVLTLLEDPEWGQWSYREIARRCQVSHDFVGKVAERHGLTGRASSDRTYTTRHGSTATINTANIAAANAARAKEEPAADPQPGAIHPLIAAVMEPEITSPATIAPIQPGMPPTLPVLELPVDLMTTGWTLVPPARSSAFFVARNDERGVSTHGFTSAQSAIDSARAYQGLIEAIEAEGWTIQRDLADPRRLRATHPRYPTITGVPGLIALHQLLPAMRDHMAPPVTLAIGTNATTADETDLGAYLGELERNGWGWYGAEYTEGGWVHLLANRSHPDMARQRLTMAGIANLVQMFALSAQRPPLPAAGTQATSPDETDLGDDLAALERSGWQWDGARTTSDGWEHILTHTTNGDLVVVTRAGIADLLSSADAGSASMVIEEWMTAPSHRPAPIVPQVLVLAGQPHPYQIPEREILTVEYHTAEMVAGRRSDGSTCKRRQERVYCLPNAAATQRVEAALTRYQQTLTAIADELRALGTYESRLAEAGGIEAAPNPLTPTVISAPEPDGYHAPSFDHALKVPRADRSTVQTHTAKMLRIAKSAATISGQQGYFVCPNDAAWERLEQHRAAATEAHNALRTLLDELGTYQAALADGRYGHQAEAQSSAQPAPAIIWPDVYAQTETIRTQIAQRSQAGVMRAALNLLRLVAGPEQIVLPPYPTAEAETLIAEIRVLLEQQHDATAPQVGRFLRAIGRSGDVALNEEPADDS